MPKKSAPPSLVDLHDAALRSLAESPMPWEPALAPLVSKEAYPRWADHSFNRYYLYLHALVKVTNPRLVVELGTQMGASALFMLRALPQNGRLITIDVSTQRSILNLVGSDDRLTILSGNDLGPWIVNEVSVRAPIDLLFIDTLHTSSQVTSELEAYGHLRAKSAIVAADDIFLNEDMKQWWNGLTTEKLDSGRDLHYTGFGLFRI